MTSLSKSQRQAILLAVLVVAFVGVLQFRTAEDPAVTPGGSSNPVAGTAGQAQRQAAEPVADVKLELLQAQREDVPESERNLFRFQEKALPPEPRATTEGPRPPPVAAVPQGPPPPPPIPLKFIGVLTAPTQAGRVAILSDGRGNTFQAREGDIIEGRYRLLRIGADSAELAYTDGRGRQVIRLSGQ